MNVSTASFCGSRGEDGCARLAAFPFGSSGPQSSSDLGVRTLKLDNFEETCICL